jgi:tRNA-specific 2-thiouridylase
MTLFPLGGMTKEEVRKLAREYQLEVALKKESQDFIAGNDYSVLFKEGREPGPILDEQGKKLGTHRGIIFYTIGQRKGLRVSSSAPLYVVAIEPERNAVIVGPEESLYADELIACDLNWVSIGSPSAPLEVQARIRQKHKEAPATLVPLGKEARVKFAQAQMSITPGQAIVFYDRELVLGGGTIKEVVKAPGVVRL